MISPTLILTDALRALLVFLLEHLSPEPMKVSVFLLKALLQQSRRQQRQRLLVSPSLVVEQQHMTSVSFHFFDYESLAELFV